MQQKLSLVKLALSNFKGIKELVVNAEGKNIRIYGDNATGKTTLFDAFVWLLFDKDSQNKKDFSIKTLDKTGNELHNLNHEVEAIFNYNGDELKLKKRYTEVWKKKRGTATNEFSGHTTDYFVDDVPVSKKEYTTKMDEIISEDIFKLLTSPTFFNEQLKWTERRSLLLKIAGDVSDDDVIAAKSELTELSELLSNRSVEDLKKIIASKKKQINDEIQKIPVRIDELSKSLPQVNPDGTALNQQLADLNNQIDELKNKKLAVQNGAAVLEKERMLQDLNYQLTTLKNTIEHDSQQEVYKAQTKLQEIKSNIQITFNKIAGIKHRSNTVTEEAARINSDISIMNKTMDELRNKYVSILAEVFSYTDSCECPTCQQSLPVEQVETARQKARSLFEEEQKSGLASINEKGKNLKEQVIKLNERLAVLKTEYEAQQSELTKVQEILIGNEKELAKANATLEKSQSSVKDATTTEEYQALLNQRNVVQSEINSLKANVSDTVSDITSTIYNLEQQLRNVNAELAQINNIKANKVRIAELEEQQKSLAVEYEQFEKQTFLLEEFTRTKVDLLNEKINSKFKHARFKLFAEQINGGLTETCETTFDGVTYQNLNNAMRINIGLDIINTLSNHYQFTAPIFIDNREAVTRLIDSDTQLISLIVSEQDKSLRIETEDI